MDHATKLLGQALDELVRLNKSVGSKPRASELLRELSEHLAEGAYPPNIFRSEHAGYLVGLKFGSGRNST